MTYLVKTTMLIVKKRYFQNSCTQIIPVAKIREVRVLRLIPSCISQLVNRAYAIIPRPKPKKRPGHNRPSKY